MPHIPTYEIQPKRAKENNLSVIWNAVLSAFFIAGCLVIFAKQWGLFTSPLVFTVIAAFVAWLVCVLTEHFIKNVYLRWTVRIIPPVLWVIIGGLGNLWDGVRIWLNRVITNWNTVHEGGVSLFAVRTTNVGIMTVTVTVAMIFGILAFNIMSKRRIFLCGILGFVLLMLQLFTGMLAPLGCGLYFISFIAMWLSLAGKIPSRQARRVSSAVMAAVFICAVCIPTTEIGLVTELRENTNESIHTLRYGEKTLPEGNVFDADKLNDSNSEMIKIRTEQEKTLYLKAFVGGDYEDGVWRELPDSAYSGDYSGILKWLKSQDFDPLTQQAQYYSLSSDSDTPEKNRLLVDISGATRCFLYTPSSALSIARTNYGESKDSRFTPKGFFGANNYTIDEISSSYPSELNVRADWVSNPQTDSQKKYLKAESVYRQFVYSAYSSPDSHLSYLINGIFWQDYKPKNDTLYSAICKVRDELRKRVTYDKNQKIKDDGEDPIRCFLTQTKKGNSVLYASTAVQALRAKGIAARYVEGYYLSSKAIESTDKSTISLTGQDAHAWVEIYFDGIGWLPVDFTPGYYFDAVTLQQMIATPEAVKKRAAYEDENGDSNNDIITVPDSGSSQANSAQAVIKNVAMISLGIITTVLLLFTAAFMILELARLVAVRRFREKYKKSTSEEQILMIKNQIFRVLEIWGIDACLGWNSKKTDELLASRFDDIKSGDYIRIASLMEKSIYGEEILKPFEIRALNAFLNKISTANKSGGFWIYWKLRYGRVFYRKKPRNKKTKIKRILAK